MSRRRMSLHYIIASCRTCIERCTEVRRSDDWDGVFGRHGRVRRTRHATRSHLHWVRTDMDRPIFVTSAEAGDSERAYRCEFCHQTPLPRSAQLIACLRIGKLGRRGLERPSELREQWRALLATRLGGLLTPLVLGERDRVPVLIARLE